MEQLMVVIKDASPGDATLSLLGWFGFFVFPVLVIASVYFGFQPKEMATKRPVENEELFDHLFEVKSKSKN